MKELVMQKVEELMAVEYDFGHFEKADAERIVEKALVALAEDPDLYDDFDEAIEMMADAEMYPED